jgi:hypothetical protein
MVAERRGLSSEEVKVPEDCFVVLNSWSDRCSSKSDRCKGNGVALWSETFFQGPLNEIPAGLIWAAPPGALTAMVMEDLIGAEQEYSLGLDSRGR